MHRNLAAGLNPRRENLASALSPPAPGFRFDPGNASFAFAGGCAALIRPTTAS